MFKENLLDQTIYILRSAGFMVSNKCDIRPRSFDLVARKEKLLILIKVLFNIDGLNEETANEMKNLAYQLNSSILIIGSKTRNQDLEDDVVYFRYNVVSINISTLQNYFIENVSPLVSAYPGGLYISIDGSILKNVRKNYNMSLGTLASIIGVSRRTISKYENEGMYASIDIVLELEEKLNIELAKPINILKMYNSTNYNNKYTPKNNKYINYSVELMLNKISLLGFDVKKAKLAPFNAISKDKNSIILTGASKLTKTALKRAELMSNISEIINTESIYLVYEKSKIKSLNKTVFIEKKDLEKINDSEDLLNLIENRKEN